METASALLFLFFSEMRPARATAGRRWILTICQQLPLIDTPLRQGVGCGVPTAGAVRRYSLKRNSDIVAVFFGMASERTQRTALEPKPANLSAPTPGSLVEHYNASIIDTDGNLMP